jgi:antitoxin ParD1/3/4
MNGLHVNGKPGVMATVTISLPESLKTFMESQVAAKGYGNVSEYFRNLLRKELADEQDARLQLLLLEGLASGKGEVATEEFWTELRSEAAQLLAKKTIGK